jgi:hypothetical protein
MDATPTPGPAGYRRSAGSARGEARRQELLDRVTDDLAANTHKVLLYHFDGVQDLLTRAVLQLRQRRIGRALIAAATQGPAQRPLSDRVRAMWPVLISEEAWVLDQAIGLAMYDPEHYAELAREASKQYLPSLLSICPDGWSDQRRLEVAELILAVLRGFLVDWRTSRDAAGIEAGFAALLRALDREAAAPE